MPKLFEYFGLVILFYSNEHEPIHVHGMYQETESRAELIVVDGRVVEIRFASVAGRKPLDAAHFRSFQLLVDRYAEEIVQRWIDYFILRKSITVRRITRRIR